MKKIVFFSSILLILLSYKGYMIYEEKVIIEKRNILNTTFEQALKSPISDFKNPNNTNTLDGVTKDDIGRNKESVSVQTIKNDNYHVIGKINIEKINYSGIILDEATEKNLKIGICKVIGNDINQIGNLVLAGHNMKNGSLFGKLKLLNINDTFTLTDKRGNSKKYRIYKKKIISPYDHSVLIQPKDKIQVTLFTCTDNGEKRLVMYAESDK